MPIRAPVNIPKAIKTLIYLMTEKGKNISDTKSCETLCITPPATEMPIGEKRLVLNSSHITKKEPAAPASENGSDDILPNSRVESSILKTFTASAAAGWP